MKNIFGNNILTTTVLNRYYWLYLTLYWEHSRTLGKNVFEDEKLSNFCTMINGLALSQGKKLKKVWLITTVLILYKNTYIYIYILHRSTPNFCYFDNVCYRHNRRIDASHQWKFLKRVKSDDIFVEFNQCYIFHVKCISNNTLTKKRDKIFPTGPVGFIIEYKLQQIINETCQTFCSTLF